MSNQSPKKAEEQKVVPGFKDRKLQGNTPKLKNEDVQRYKLPVSKIKKKEKGKEEERNKRV